MRLQACGRRVFPPSSNHPSPKNKILDLWLFKTNLQDGACALAQTALETQSALASASEPHGSADGHPINGLRLPANGAGSGRDT